MFSFFDFASVLVKADRPGGAQKATTTTTAAASFHRYFSAAVQCVLRVRLTDCFVCGVPRLVRNLKREEAQAASSREEKRLALAEQSSSSSVLMETPFFLMAA